MTESPTPNRRSAAVVVALVVAIAAGAGFFAQQRLSRPNASATPPAAPANPAPAPAKASTPNEAQRPLPEVLPGFTLKDRDDKPRTLADWKGRPLVVNFWPAVPW